MSKVIIYSTSGRNAQEVEVEGTTWKDLQRAMDRKSVSYSGMKAVVGESRVTLESENALLPNADFTLFLMPIKTKSGADRKQLMATIKEFVAKNPSRKGDFIIDGKNMTQLSTAVIEGLVKDYILTSPISPAPKIEVKEKVAEVIESVKEAKKEVAGTAVEQEIDYSALIAAKKVEIEDAVKAGRYSILGGLGEELTKLEADEKEYIKQKEEVAKEAERKAKEEKVEQERKEKEEREAKEKSEKNEKKAQLEELDRKARDIARDFKDVRI